MKSWIAFIFLCFVSIKSYHWMYERSKYNSVIYNLNKDCRTCATLNENHNLIFTECSVTYLSSQRFDIIFQKYSPYYHTIKTTNYPYQLTSPNLMTNFQLVVANGRRGYFIISEEMSLCLTNKIDVPFPYVANKSEFFKPCKKLSKNQEEIIFYISDLEILPKTTYLYRLSLEESSLNTNNLISQTDLNELSSNFNQVKISLSSNTELLTSLELILEQEKLMNISESSYYLITNINSLVSNNINYGCFFRTKISDASNNIKTPFYNRERCVLNSVYHSRITLIKFNRYKIRFKNVTRNEMLDSSIFETNSNIVFTYAKNGEVYTYKFTSIINSFNIDLSFGNYTTFYSLKANHIIDISASSTLAFNVDNCNLENEIFVNLKEISTSVKFSMINYKSNEVYDTSI